MAQPKITAEQTTIATVDNVGGSDHAIIVADSGTAFPGSPTVGQQFYLTTGITDYQSGLYTWDGSIWHSRPAPSTTDAGWQDWLGSGFIAPSTGTSRPNFSLFRDGIYLWAFNDSSTTQLWLNIHVTHDWKFGTDVYPHIHWSHTSTPTSPNSTVRWGIEYTAARGYDVDAYPATTTVYLEQDVNGAAAYTHHIIEVDAAHAIAGSSLDVDAVILMRIFRDAAHVDDTLTGDAYLHFVDVHYQADNILTRERNQPFTKYT